MADTKISNLGAVTSLLDTDELVLASAGTTKKIAVQNLAFGYSVILHHPKDAATGAFTNLAASTVGAVSDPSYRQMINLEGFTKARMMGRIGGTLVAATKIRIQYHTGGDPTISSADGGWTTLMTSAGSHTVNSLFYTAEASIPSGAQIAVCLIRAVLFDGDGAADPTLSACTFNVYA